ncbi:restriction endonuclease subunit S [Pseudoscardovia suis]
MSGNVPELRFAGFTDPWEQRKFGDILDYERPDAYIVSSEDYDDSFPTPVLTANKGFVLGHTRETNVHDGECVIFDDFTLDCKFVDFPFMVKSSAVKILTPKPNVDIHFVFELLNSTNIEVLGHARHYISVVQPTVVRVPTLSEQQQVGELFQRLDSLITLHQRKHDQLATLKKSLLEKMFV